MTMPRLSTNSAVAAVAGFAINTGISAMENWEVTKGDIGRTAAYTGIDVVMDIGPLKV